MYPSLVDFKAGLEPHIAAFIERKRKDIRGVTGCAFISDVFGHVATVIGNGGKRARPYVAYLAYLSEGGKADERVLEALVGLELFHVFVLIHDDVIDRAPKRHDVETVHEYVRRAHPFDAEGAALAHFGDAQAILAGDAVFNWSRDVLCEYGPVAVSKRVAAAFSRMIDEVVIGQMLDVATSAQHRVTDADLDTKTELKSARYTFTQPMRIGALLRGADIDADADRSELYKTLGFALGMAFQMQDDLLDMVGDEKKTGKVVFKDIEAGQHTHFTQYVFKQGTEADRELLSRLFGKPLREADRAELLALFERSGAIANGRRRIISYLDDARAAIDGSHWNAGAKAAWHTLTDQLSRRSS